MSKKRDGSSLAGLAHSLATHLMDTIKDARTHLDENSAKGAVARGQVFQLSGYLEDAVESYTDALALDPEMDEAAFRLARAQLLFHQPERALATAMKLAQRSPDFDLKEMTSDQYINTMTLLGDALVFNNRSADAIEAYKIARTSSKRDAFAAGRLAQVYLTTGEPKKAIELAKNVGKSPRFRSLANLLALGERNAALLPAFRPGSAADFVGTVPVGRPLMVDSLPRQASIDWGNNEWCADISKEAPPR